MHNNNRHCLMFTTCFLALLFIAFTAGCGETAPAPVDTTSTAPPAPVMNAPKETIRTVFLCVVKEAPQKNFGGVPHDNRKPDEPFADTYRMMSPVTMESVFLGTPEPNYFILGYVDGDTRYSMAAGEKYFVLMTEESPSEAYMGYDGVYLLKDNKLKVVSGSGIPPSIDGLTLEDALAKLGIE